MSLGHHSRLEGKIWEFEVGGIVIKLALKMNVSHEGILCCIRNLESCSEDNKELPKGFDSKATWLHLYFVKITLEQSVRRMDYVI